QDAQVMRDVGNFDVQRFGDLADVMCPAAEALYDSEPFRIGDCFEQLRAAPRFKRVVHTSSAGDGRPPTPEKRKKNPSQIIVPLFDQSEQRTAKANDRPRERCSRWRSVSASINAVIRPRPHTFLRLALERAPQQVWRRLHRAAGAKALRLTV